MTSRTRFVRDLLRESDDPTSPFWRHRDEIGLVFDFSSWLEARLDRRRLGPLPLAIDGRAYRRRVLSRARRA